MVLKNNSRKTLEGLYGNPDDMALRPCECWPVHFDPCGLVHEPGDLTVDTWLQKLDEKSGK